MASDTVVLLGLLAVGGGVAWYVHNEASKAKQSQPDQLPPAPDPTKAQIDLTPDLDLLPAGIRQSALEALTIVEAPASIRMLAYYIEANYPDAKELVRALRARADQLEAHQQAGGSIEDAEPMVDLSGVPPAMMATAGLPTPGNLRQWNALPTALAVRPACCASCAQGGACQGAHR